jgi:hypothetical protein
MQNANRWPTKVPLASPPKSRVAERLLVHAKLCRQMACASLDEALGEQLLKLADECLREATEILATERLAANSGGQIATMAVDTAYK